MRISGWGQYPWNNSKIHTPKATSDIEALITSQISLPLIARGMGRSYGDSSLAEEILDTKYFNHFLHFNPSTGVLNCSSGVTLCEIIDNFMRRGWFLPVTPGTRFISLGGAIASDVHGKNHHIAGCISEFIQSLMIYTPSHGVIECSRTAHTELFFATCGGMGLTGIILSAKIQLKPISSTNLIETSIKTRNIKETLSVFEEHSKSTYSVAWIDCLAQGKDLGRSIVSLAEHCTDSDLQPFKERSLNIPFNSPGALVNKYSVKIFNAIYYHKARQESLKREVHCNSYFYPLDSIHNWNRLYGNQGLLQYQCVIPEDDGEKGLTDILTVISRSQQGSFLAVLKAFGKENRNLLSFPCKGYTLALDFKNTTSTHKLMNELDDIVLRYGGRLYLTKDARMSEKTFKASYPTWEEFCKVREAYGADKFFNSLQSKRLGI